MVFVLKISGLPSEGYIRSMPVKALGPQPLKPLKLVVVCFPWRILFLVGGKTKLY